MTPGEEVRDGESGAGTDVVRRSRGAEGERLDNEDASAQQPVVELERGSVSHVRCFSAWETSVTLPLRPEI